MLDEPTSVLAPREAEEMLGLVQGLAHGGAEAAVRLSVRNLRAAGDAGRPVLDIAALDVRVHEIVGVAGVSGNRQKELLEALGGQRPASGAVRVDGIPYAATRRQSKVRVIPEEPLRNGCVPGMSVVDNLNLWLFDRNEDGGRRWWLDLRGVRRRAARMIAGYGVRAASPEASVGVLSGGNVQRCVLARELDGVVSLLVVANPCFGLDVKAVAEVRARPMAARNAGCAVLLVSEDLDEILELADRIVVMRRGRVVHEAPAAGADPHARYRRAHAGRPSRRCRWGRHGRAKPGTGVTLASSGRQNQEGPDAPLPDHPMRSAIPASGDYWLCRARLPDGRALVDLRIAGGAVAAIAPAGAAPSGVDLAGGQVWPCFVDVHTHLDKGHIWRRTPNPDGTFAAALAAVAADRPRWTEADLRLRMEYGLACAHAHGTAAIRTHLDSRHPTDGNAWRMFRALRDEWAGRIALQAVSLCALEGYDGDEGRALADQVADAGGVLGGATRLGGPFDAPPPPEFPDRLDQLFALAEARGLDIDLHVDESGEAGARALREVARTALRRGFRNRIQCGHCCSLSVQPEAFAREVVAAVAEAGIAVVTLPMCNMYLQDRAPARTPRWRGVTLVHELRAAGIPVSVASDNCGDPFYPYGDHDMLEVLREATRILHLDHSPSWSAAIHATPAGVMGLDAGGVRVGGPADLVLFSARHPHELLARPQSDRVVLRRGRVLDACLPDPAVLDGVALPDPATPAAPGAPRAG